jgi:hypothetical protein
VKETRTKVSHPKSQQNLITSGGFYSRNQNKSKSYSKNRNGSKIYATPIPTLPYTGSTNAR